MKKLTADSATWQNESDRAVMEFPSINGTAPYPLGGVKALTPDGDSEHDSELAKDISRSLGDLQKALDAATMAGLNVEPRFKTLSNRFASRGVTADSHVCEVRVYRQLV